ncbi:MAG TPA: SBBP repeat-containing protein [Blastocatellia bacterium]|nr:SBBP repeat-containing protein [Blastocatellia bacterium]
MFVRQSRQRRSLVIWFTLAGLLNGVILPASANSPARVTVAPAPAPNTRASEAARARAAYGNLPMRFERNQGQFDRRVRFAARGAGYALWLTADEAVLSLSSGERRAPARAAQTAVIRMKLLNANRAACVTGEAEMAGRSNYFVGSDPAKWQAGVSNYARAVYRGVYRGVDMVYYGNGRELEYDFKLAAGANPAAIAWRIRGAERLRLDASGELVMATAAGEVRQHRPVAYQEINGARRAVAARYVLRGGGRVGFALGSYDRRRPLVIDPVLGYSTYLGGNNYDSTRAIAVDAAGNAYVVGQTYSTDFPTALPVQPQLGGASDVFVTKLNASGTALVYSTYLGGSDYDYGNSIAVDAAGNAYVTGYTLSTNFPTVNPLQTDGGSEDAFVAKLNPAGTALVYSTYLGGSSFDEGQSIAADAAGNAYVGGWTGSTNFPTVNALQPTFGGGADIFVSKLNPAGTALTYSTYLGGTANDSSVSLAIDAAGNVYLAGATDSPDFPTVNPIQADFKGKNVYKTPNGATSWEAINNGLPVYTQVNALAVDPQTPSTVYAATTSGVYKSMDGGNTWSLANSGLPHTTFYALAINPATTSTLFLATQRGVYRSTDAGASWAAGSPLMVATYSLAIDPVNPANVYAGRTNGIYKSTDGGGTFWEPAGLYSQTVNCLVIDSAAIYAGTNDHLYKSTDGSESWSQLGNGPLQSILALATSPADEATIYAVVYAGGVIKSTDGGTSWAAARNGLNNSWVRALAIDPQVPSTVYAGAGVAYDGFVAKLDAAGAALTYATYLGGDDDDWCAAIAIDAAGNAYLTGATRASDFPTANPLRSYGGNNDAFLAKLNATGTALLYSTYLGGSGYDVGTDVAVDAAGNAFVTGNTYSVDFLATDPERIYSDVFVVGLNPSGDAITYSTSLGGAWGEEDAEGIAVDPAGNVYVTGYTSSIDFPVTPGAFQTALRGYPDAFVTKIAFSCSPSLAAAGAVFTARGGSGSVKVRAAAGCEWQAASNANWLILVSAPLGVGDGSANFEVRENPHGAFRSGTLTVGGQTFTVNQTGTEGEGCQVAFSPSFTVYPASGGFGGVSVNAEADCVWTAQTSASWITITSAANGVGNGQITYTVMANPNSTSRKATIRVGNQTMSVKQKGH